MKKCIGLGKEAMSTGNPPVGSILVKNNSIIGIGREAVKPSNDITKHAEIEAINDAITNKHTLNNTVLYTTHEPCIMCSYVIRHHHIKTIVFGATSKYVGGITSAFKLLKTESIPSWKESPELISGVLEDECTALSKTYQTIQRQ